jgi:hypothetical protein
LLGKAVLWVYYVFYIVILLFSFSNDRKFVPAKTGKAIMYYCKKVLGHLKEEQKLPHAVDQGQLLQLLQGIQHFSTPYANFIRKFLLGQLSDMMMKKAASFLLPLCGEGAVSAYLPFPYHQHIKQTMEALKEGSLPKGELVAMLQYNFQLSQLLIAAHKCNEVDLTTNFISNVLEIVSLTHTNQKQPDPPQKQPNTYDPSSGVCYYFTEHGNQLRSMGEYRIAGGKSKLGDGDFDDVPPEADRCKKKYPHVGLGGFSYMLFFFCPIHGHVYGFHLIDGFEGPKDVFSPIYKFKPTAPSELFYDFACQLNEYCLNREPEFFELCRFWHDVFHSVGHKCGCLFKSRRVTGLAGVNTEICEQFNSYLQCIKYTGSHLSQTHMMLFTQFMVHLFNQHKTERFKKISRVSVEGTL